MSTDWFADTLGQAWHNTVGVLFNAGHFLSLGPLFVAFAVAFAVVFHRLRQNGDRRPATQKILSALFPRRVFLQGAANIGY